MPNHYIEKYKKDKKFLEENWDSKEFSFIFRKSWKTYTNMEDKHKPKQKTLKDFQ